MKRLTPAYSVEVGVLIPQTHEEFKAYSMVYDEKNGFYDENQWASIDLQKAAEEVMDYVKHGVNNTYGTISIAGLCEVVGDESESDLFDIVDPSYTLEYLYYSVAKIDGKIVENFIDIPNKVCYSDIVKEVTQ